MKKFVIALLGFVIVMNLLGCGGGGGGGDNPPVYNGDNGQGLIDNGFTEVKAAYDAANKELKLWAPDNDADGSKRLAAVMNCVSKEYASNVATTHDVTSYDKFAARLKDLIVRYKMEGMQLVPYQTLSKKGDPSCIEKSKLFFAKGVDSKGAVYNNQSYILNEVKWQKDSSNSWKIVSGLHELGYSQEDIKKKKIDSLFD